MQLECMHELTLARRVSTTVKITLKISYLGPIEVGGCGVRTNDHTNNQIIGRKQRPHCSHVLAARDGVLV
jgi:hypothetical protein